MRELAQIIGMYVYGLQYFWISDFWNLLNIACIIFVFVTLVPLFKVNHQNTGLFRILFSFAAMLVWLEVIAFVKTISLLFATFVLAFIQIIRDLVSFLVILVCFMLAFANVFTIILPLTDDDQTGKGGPFSSLGDSFLTTYTMMLGGYNRWWFDSSSVAVTNFSISAFAIFMFVVYIVLLNMLIAIVGDSYAFAMTKAPLLFDETQCAMSIEHIVTGVVYLNNLLLELKYCSLWWPNAKKSHELEPNTGLKYAEGDLVRSLHNGILYEAKVVKIEGDKKIKIHFKVQLRLFFL